MPVPFPGQPRRWLNLLANETDVRGHDGTAYLLYNGRIGSSFELATGPPKAKPSSTKSASLPCIESLAGPKVSVEAKTHLREART